MIPRAVSDTIRIGPQEAVLGHLNFLAPDKWQSVMKRDLTPLTKQELKSLNKDLKRQLDVGKVYAKIEPIIEVLSHSGRITSRTDNDIKPRRRKHTKIKCT